MGKRTSSLLSMTLSWACLGLLLVSWLHTPSALATDVVRYRVVGVRYDDTLNFRSGPGSSNRILGEIPPDGVGVWVTGKASYNGSTQWLPVRYAGISGWAAGRYLQRYTVDDDDLLTLSSCTLHSADGKLWHTTIRARGAEYQLKMELRIAAALVGEPLKRTWRIQDSSGSNAQRWETEGALRSTKGSRTLNKPLSLQPGSYKLVFSVGAQDELYDTCRRSFKVESSVSSSSRSSSSSSRSSSTSSSSSSSSPERYAETLLKRYADDVLECYHPSQGYDRISSVYSRKVGTRGEATGRIRMTGFLSSYWMDVELSYDPASEKVRVQVENENTLFPASSTCDLRSWVSVSRIDDAAKASSQEFARQVTVGVVTAGVATAYLMSSEEAESRVGSCVEQEVVRAGSAAAAGLALNDARAQATMASVLAQSYKGDIKVSSTARDVAISEFKRELGRHDQSLATAASSAEFLYCLFK